MKMTNKLLIKNKKMLIGKNSHSKLDFILKLSALGLGVWAR